MRGIPRVPQSESSGRGHSAGEGAVAGEKNMAHPCEENSRVVNSYASFRYKQLSEVPTVKPCHDDVRPRAAQVCARKAE